MKVFFRTDASIHIGSGHVMRCLTLADVLEKEGVDVSFISRQLPGNLCSLIEKKGYKVYKLPHKDMSIPHNKLSLQHAQWLGAPWETDANETMICIKEKGFVDWLIVDHYAIDYRCEEKLRSYAKRIMVIDDLADRKHDCDVLLDQNLHENLENRYDGLVPEGCIKLLGPKYALLRKEFVETRKRLRKRDGTVRRILIFMGGSDPSNETSKALRAVQMLKRPDIATDVIVGVSNPHQNEVDAIVAQMPNATYHLQVENMAELMAAADLNIGSGGASTWERCCVGLPSIVITIADNQIGFTKRLSKDGYNIYSGWYENVTEQSLIKDLSFLLSHQEILQQISLKTKKLVDGKGTERVLEKVKDLKK